MKSKAFWIGGVVVLLLAIGVTFTFAQSALNVYYGCVNNESGTIKVFLNQEDWICKTNDIPITWNEVGEQGPQGDPGADGADGQDGAPGEDGLDGLHCWDLNQDGIGNPEEDTNGDTYFNALDCQGPPGEPGPQGEEGPPGIVSLDDLNGTPCGADSGVLEVIYHLGGSVELRCPGALSFTESAVFVTQSTYAGYFKMNGVIPDDVCQTEAEAAGLEGTFKAWISDDWTSPVQAFVDTGLPYKLVDGTVISHDFAGLFDGNINNPINRDAYGQLITEPYYTWTGTSSDGHGTGSDCDNWMKGDSMGSYGLIDYTNNYWSAGGGLRCQDRFLRFYCFQQP